MTQIASKGAKETFNPGATPTTYSQSYLRSMLTAITRAMWNPVVRTITASTTANAGDNGGLILCDCTAGAVAVTLPLATTYQNGVITIKKIDASGNAASFVGTVDATVNPSTTTQWKTLTAMSNGTAWFQPINP